MINKNISNKITFFEFVYNDKDNFLISMREYLSLFHNIKATIFFKNGLSYIYVKKVRYEVILEAFEYANINYIFL